MSLSSLFNYCCTGGCLYFVVFINLRVVIQMLHSMVLCIASRDINAVRSHFGAAIVVGLS